ncbi:3689_t:CDS:1, partial [Acaulospora morrowiae]
REFNHSTNTLLQYLPDFLQDFGTRLIELLMSLISYVTFIGVIPSRKLQVVAQKCVFWNKNIYYNPLFNNCQHFIEDILKKLDLKFEPQGEFKKFLDRIIYNADDSFLFQEKEFFSRQDLDQFADQKWCKIQNIWDKRLLLCYSDMMESMYQIDGNSKFGPMTNKEKWHKREYELREN